MKKELIKLESYLKIVKLNKEANDVGKLIEEIEDLKRRIDDLEAWKLKHNPYDKENPHHSHFNR